MNTYRVWYGDGAAILVNAMTTSDARRKAEELAERDGYDGLAITKVEQLNSE